MPRTPMRHTDLLETATLCRETLTAWADRDWSVRAGDLEWSCRHTLDHIIDGPIFLGGNAALRSDSWVFPVRNGDADAELPDMLEAVVTSSVMLERICAAMAAEDRGFHPAGQTDAEGFRAEGCAETLQHTYDIAKGFGEDFHPPQDLAGRVVDRLFPWAPDADEHPDRWEALLWASGRIALPTRERLEPDWWVQMAPLDEWDGTRKVRTVPPPE